jgi:hypothetical protein
MTSNAFLVLFTPKIPATLLNYFLKGVGCIDVVTAVENDLESWVDFKFLDKRFQGHRDCEVWHFFADIDCPPELVVALSEKLRIAQKPLRAWAAVCRGIC